MKVTSECVLRLQKALMNANLDTWLSLLFFVHFESSSSPGSVPKGRSLPAGPSGSLQVPSRWAPFSLNPPAGLTSWTFSGSEAPGRYRAHPAG